MNEELSGNITDAMCVSAATDEFSCAEKKTNGARCRHIPFVTSGILLAASLSLYVAARRRGVAMNDALYGKIGGRDMVEIRPSCPVMPARPPYEEKARRARWMVRALDWGVLSTISTRITSSSGGAPVPFGNIYSFADGPCDTSTGVPYMFASDLDQSMKDIAENAIVSLTLSEAALPGSVLPGECQVGGQEGYGDPENPPCARLVLTGEFVKLSPPSEDGSLDGDEKEWAFAQEALLERHPSMAKMPADHLPFIGKIFLKDIWFIDMYGGASILDLDEYYAASSSGRNVGANEASR